MVTLGAMGRAKNGSGGHWTPDGLSCACRVAGAVEDYPFGDKVAVFEVADKRLALVSLGAFGGVNLLPAAKLVVLDDPSDSGTTGADEELCPGVSNVGWRVSSVTCARDLAAVPLQLTDSSGEKTGPCCLIRDERLDVGPEVLAS